MPLTLANMRANVRTHLDVASQDIPDSLIDSWVRLSHSIVCRYERRWPFFYREATTSVGTPNVWAFSTITGANGPVEQITQIIMHDGGEVFYLDPDVFLRVRHPTSTDVGVPAYYTVRHDSTSGVRYATFHPAPSATLSFTVRYYKAPYDFVSAGASAAPDDLPEEFHHLIQTGAIYQAFMHQEMLDQASAYKLQFDETLQALKRGYMVHQFDQPLRIGEVNERDLIRPVGRLRYPWEY